MQGTVSSSNTLPYLRSFANYKEHLSTATVTGNECLCGFIMETDQGGASETCSCHRGSHLKDFPTLHQLLMVLPVSMIKQGWSSSLLQHGSLMIEIKSAVPSYCFTASITNTYTHIFVLIKTHTHTYKDICICMSLLWLGLVYRMRHCLLFLKKCCFCYKIKCYKEKTRSHLLKIGGCFQTWNDAVYKKCCKKVNEIYYVIFQWAFDSP